MGICGTFWRETKLMARNYPPSRRHRRPARRFVHFCFVRSPRARPGKPGVAWTRWMDESPNPGENEEPGRGWAEYRRPDVKNGCRGRVGGRLEML
jgi:hypothetical protein